MTPKPRPNHFTDFSSNSISSKPSFSKLSQLIIKPSAKTLATKTSVASSNQSTGQAGCLELRPQLANLNMPVSKKAYSNSLFVPSRSFDKDANANSRKELDVKPTDKIKGWLELKNCSRLSDVFGQKSSATQVIVTPGTQTEFRKASAASKLNVNSPFSKPSEPVVMRAQPLAKEKPDDK